MSLFGAPTGPHILLDDHGSEIVLHSDWLGPVASDRALLRLPEEVRPAEAQIRLFGKTIPIPRLQAWHGTKEASYQYSGAALDPLPLTPILQELLGKLHASFPSERFNSVLVNLYRNGQDAVGWHADDEPELGPEPCIASLSLGTSRRFLFKPRPQSSSEPAFGTPNWPKVAPSKLPRRAEAVELAHGDLLVMRGRTQSTHLHCAPRTTRELGARWNLTFRWVQPRESHENERKPLDFICE